MNDLKSLWTLLAGLASFTGASQLMADEFLVIDDRRMATLESALGTDWRMFTDGVMGGVSTGNLHLDNVDGRACLRLRGDVRLDNNGGFVQAALDTQDTRASDASSYQGIMLEVYGNNEAYNVHLRTDDVWLPWQSYRATFEAPARWLTVKLPFAQFSNYRISKPLDLEHLKRIGILAIGQAFTADLCIASLALYRETDQGLE